MNDISLLIDLHKDNHRQAPGDDAQTELALRLAGIDPNQPLQLADIGCGSGASTLCLARNLNARICAVDFLPEFLEILDARAEAEGLSGKITTLAASMEELPFAHHTFDVLWAESSIYNMGFQKGITAWKPFLKPGGLLVVSEITWITAKRPAEIQEYWERQYPEIDLPSVKIAQLEGAGYTPVAYFALPESCWTDHYYAPLQSRFELFLAQHNHSPQAHEVVAAERREIELYQQFKNFYSYGVYVARLPAP